jgi:MFS family permease
VDIRAAMTDQQRDGTQIPYPPKRTAWYATIVLSILIWLSVLDRFIISLLVGPIKHDLGISDVQFGVLNGFAFTVTYAVFGVALGFLTDRYHRRWIIFAGVSFWSMATAACGLAHVYWQLLLARIGVGAGEATLGPCASSLLTDLWPRERLTTAMSVFHVGTSIGAGMAYIIGGQIVQLVSHTPILTLPLIGAMRSWQVVFLIVGIPGALLSLIVFTFEEPVRRGFRSAQQAKRSFFASNREMWAFVKTRPRFFLCHYLGFAFASAVLVGNGAWYAPHLARNFGWNPSKIGLTVGLMTSLPSIIGMLTAGRMSDWLFRRGHRDAQLRWYAACALIATPLGVIAMTSSNPWVYIGFTFLTIMLICGMPSCAMTALNLVTPNELRGTGIAFFNMTAGIFGAGSGPVLIAAVSDYIFHDEKAIGRAMAVVIAVCLPLAALFLSLAFRAMRDAVHEAEQWANTVAPQPA